MKKYIAFVALCPWLAYLLLGQIAEPKSAWAFVTACLWVATPVLVVVAALRGYDEGLKKGAAKEAVPVKPDHALFQPTQLGQLQ